MRIRRLFHGVTLAVLALSVSGALALIPATGNAEPRWARGNSARPPGLARGWTAQRSAPVAYRGGGWQGAPSGRSSGGGWSYGGATRPSGGWTYGTPRYRGGSGYYPRGGYYGYYPRYGYYGYYRPRTYFSFGLGFGSPYYYVYCPSPVYVVHRPARVVVLADLPPAGCEYYDPYCDESFSCLADYEEHLEGCGHTAILEVVDIDSGSCLHRYSWASGRWSMMY